jgi:hypothetical protein
MKNRRKPVSDFNDIVGNQVGELTIIKYLYSEPNKQGVGNHHYYRCTCNCGNEHVVKRKSLLKEEVRSCGCLLKEARSQNGKNNKKKYGEEAIYRALYIVHRNQAKYRNLSFTISGKVHKQLILSNCHYCGIEPSNLFNPKYHDDETLKYNGIDRKNGEIGYEESNLVSCCLKCNKSKNTMNYEEFIEYLRRLIDFQTKSNCLILND